MGQDSFEKRCPEWQPELCLRTGTVQEELSHPIPPTLGREAWGRVSMLEKTRELIRTKPSAELVTTTTTTVFGHQQQAEAGKST